MHDNDSRELMAAIHDSRPVSGLSHTLYKYPARFSPLFVREVISSMTKPGDAVLDPFVGGGTSLVEAMASGRDGIGLDINQLAVFVTKVKTRLFTSANLTRVSACMDFLSDLPLSPIQPQVLSSPYCVNMADRSTWRLRSFLGLCLERIKGFGLGVEKELLRSILLRTAQWALDCRKETPTIPQFREQLKLRTREAVQGAELFRQGVLAANRKKRPRSLCLLRSAIGSEHDERLKRFGRPSLVITSPPYPGVHVLYHRWQVRGRRETAAPYWIANLVDGHHASYYTFADRNRRDISKYLETAREAFASVRGLVSTGTPLVQMVAFGDPDEHLGPYLQMLADAGWTEMKETSERSRLWRTVPGRKWYTSVAGGKASRELVLFHTAC